MPALARIPLHWVAGICIGACTRSGGEHDAAPESADTSALACAAACRETPVVCRDGALHGCEGVEGCAPTVTACPSGVCFDDLRCGAITNVQWGAARTETLVSIAVDASDHVWLAGTSKGFESDPADDFSEKHFVLLATPDGEVVHREQFAVDAHSMERAVALHLRRGGGAYHLSHDLRHRRYRVKATLIRELDAQGKILFEHELDPTEWTTDFAVLGETLGPSAIDGLVVVGSSGGAPGERTASLTGNVGSSPWYGLLKDVGPLAAVAPAPPDDIVAVGDTGVAGRDDRTEVVVARWSRKGELQWERRWGGDGWSRPSALAVDESDGAIYVVGETDGKIGAERFGGRDWFLSKVDRDGELAWSRQWGGPGWDVPRAIAVVGPGRVVAVGQIDRTGSDEGVRGTDVWLMEVDAGGEVQRGWSWGTPHDDRATAVAAGADGRIFVGGETYGKLGRRAHGGSDIFMSVLGPAVSDAQTTDKVVSISLPIRAPKSRDVAAPTAVGAPRPFLVFTEVSSRRLRATRASSGVAIDELPVVDAGGRATAEIGSNVPTLSWDGRWLAHVDRGIPRVARVDGTVAHRLGDVSPSEVDTYFSGFSPDSKRLLYYESEVPSEEGPSLEGFSPGFYLLTLDDPTATPIRIPELEGFTAWSAEPNRILRMGGRHGENALLQFDLDTRTERVLQTIDSLYGYGQPSFVGELMAYNWGGPDSGRDGVSQIFTARIDGTDRRARTDTQRWASVQFPKLSPDTRHVAYCFGGSLEIVNLASGQETQWARGAPQPTTCSTLAWISTSELLVLEDSDLLRVRVDGSTSIVATDADAVAVAGELP